MKVSVIVPVYNEVATCGEVFTRLSQKKIEGVDFEFVIVESGSTDGSSDIVKEFAVGRADTVTIFEDKANGKGFAVRRGLAVATGDVIMIQDADLEYDFDDYEKLISPLKAGTAHVVLGSRHAGGSTWRIRNYGATGEATAALINLGHLAFTWIFNFLFRQNLKDPATMFKIFRRECIEGMNFTSSRFDFDFELICKLVKRGYKPLEVPVSYKSRGFSSGKKIRIFRDPPTWLWVLFRLGIRGYLTKRPTPKQIMDLSDPIQGAELSIL